MTRVIVHIDRLVLRGVDRADAAGLARSLEAEMQRLMTTPGVAQGLAAQGDTPRVRAGRVQVGHGETGRAAAGAIVRGLKP